jgi:hypothetical protein
MSFARYLHLAAVLLVAFATTLGCYAQDPVVDKAIKQIQKIQDQLRGVVTPAESDATEGQDGGDLTDEEQKKLNDFYEEIEDLLAGRDEFSLIVKKLKGDLKTEFQENERQLIAIEEGKPTDGSQLRNLADRQKTIAQSIIELDLRISSTRRSDTFQLQRDIRERFNVFRRGNARLARSPEFLRKEQELTMQAMRQGAGFGRRNQPATLTETMRSLSATDVQPSPNELTLRAHPGEQKGAIQELRTGLRKLLKLRWVGESLAIDREHWDEAFAGQTISDIRGKVDRLLEKAGAPEQVNDDPRGAIFAAMQPTQARTNLQRLFHELRSGNAAGAISQQSSGQVVVMTLNNGSLNVRMTTHFGRFQRVIQEVSAPSRIVRMVDQDGRLEIIVVGDMVHRFVQHAEDQRLMVDEIFEEKVLSYQAESFADFYRHQPRFVEDRFFPLLNHLGIIPPTSRFDQQTVHRLLENLQLDKAAARQEAERLVADLDSDRYTRRESAFKKLRSGLERYHPALYAMTQDPDISVEARASIRKLLDLSRSNSV